MYMLTQCIAKREECLIKSSKSIFALIKMCIGYDIYVFVPHDIFKWHVLPCWGMSLCSWFMLRNERCWELKEVTILIIFYITNILYKFVLEFIICTFKLFLKGHYDKKIQILLILIYRCDIVYIYKYI